MPFAKNCSFWQQIADNQKTLLTLLLVHGNDTLSMTIFYCPENLPCYPPFARIDNPALKCYGKEKYPAIHE